MQDGPPEEGWTSAHTRTKRHSCTIRKRKATLIECLGLSRQLADTLFSTQLAGRNGIKMAYDDIKGQTNGVLMMQSRHPFFLAFGILHIDYGN